jgi:hypothetical protein
MNLLALKLILTPLFVGGATLVARRFGPRVGGWLVALPLTSGPVTFYLTLEQGTGFAARAAQATLLGQISFAAFCLTYRWLSLRSGWLGSWFGSWSAFFILTFVLQQVSLPLPLAFISVMGVLLLTLLLLPDPQDQIVKTSHPAWDLPGRILVATAFVLLLTGTAAFLGPRLSGLLLPLPIYATVIAIFTHHTYGAAAAWQVLRGVVVGSFAYALFFLLIATLIESRGILVAFGCAIAGALLIQGCSLWLMHRQSPHF